MQRKKAGLLNTNHAKMTKINDKTSWMWYILMGMYLVYFAQSTLFPGAAIIGQGLIFLILLIGFVSLIRTLLSPAPVPGPLKWIIALLIVLTIAYILSPKFVYSRLLSTTSTLNQFKDMVAYFLPIFTGYQIGLHKRLSPNQWIVIVLILLTIAINSFLEIKVNAIQRYKQEESTNNSAYIFLYILPFIPLILRKYKIMAFALLSTCFIFVMMGAKRGAILCMVGMLIYLMWWYLKKRGVSFNTIVVIQFLITALVIGFNYFFTESDYLQNRLKQTLEGGMSHRDVIYSQLWGTWVNAGFPTQIFGQGSAQTVIIAGNYAHNDWLELLTDVGLLGVFIYLMIFVSLLHSRNKLQKHSPEQAAFTAVIVFWFLKTIFSMGMGIMGGISMMLIGTLIGNANATRQYEIKRATQGLKPQAI